MELQHLFRILTSNCEGSNIYLPRYPEPCQELQSVNEALLSTTHIGQPNDICGIKQNGHHLKAKVTSSPHQKTEKDESEQFVDKHAGNSSQAMVGVEVNGGFTQMSKNWCRHWCSNIKNYVSNAASGDKLEETRLAGVMNYVYSLKYNFWDLLFLLLLLTDVMFSFVGRRPGIAIGVAISILLVVVISMFNNGSYDFAILMYNIARYLKLLSLVLQQTQWEWLSYLMAGSAYSWVILFILRHSFSFLPLYYAGYGLALLFGFVLYSVLYGNTRDRNDEAQ